MIDNLGNNSIKRLQHLFKLLLLDLPVELSQYIEISLTGKHYLSSKISALNMLLLIMCEFRN